MKKDKTKEIDENGYITIPKHFTSRGYTYDFIEDLGNHWNIYSVIGAAAGVIIDYELIQFYKSEQWELAGNIIPKKWNYPQASQFGFRGFSLPSIQACKNKLKRIQENKEFKQEKQDNKTKPTLDIPKNTEFVIPEMAKKLGIEPIVLSNELTKLKGLGIKIEVVGERKNPRGRNSKVYMIKE